MLKQFIKGFIRGAGLIQVADKARYLYQKTYSNSANVKYLKEYPSLTFPPPYLIYESHKLDYRKYYVNGEQAAKNLYKDFATYLNFNNSKILDWGCGPARVVRHFPKLAPGASFYGSDYNNDSIEWNEKYIRSVQFSKNSLTPPIQFENEFFDGIYGLSVFTHLSEDNHHQWIKELSRILKIEGILIITTHGEVFKERLQLNEQREFIKGQLVVQGKTIEGHRTFAAFHPPEFMRALFKRNFEILSHIPGKKEPRGLSQDKWFLKRIL